MNEALDAYLEKAFFEPYARRARDAALEEAAKAIEGYDTAQCDTGWGPSIGELAASIRALKIAAAPEQ